MKTETHLRFSLLFPYFLWFITALFLAFEDSHAPRVEMNPIAESIITVAAYYTLGIFIWALPYTILAASLWIWSFKQVVNRIAIIFAFSPFMMTALVVLEVIIIALASGDSVSSDFDSLVITVGSLSIPFGYAVIGITAGIYKLLRLVDFIKTETETSPTQAV